MFAFFKKKVSPKGGGKIHHLCWGDPEGWLAFDGGKGILTMLNTKSVLAEDTSSSCVATYAGQGRSELPFSQTLAYPGKANDTLQAISWSSAENRLSSLDESGCFAVWKLEKKVWVNEILHTSAWRGVADWAISPDGKRLSVLCWDGRLYVCSANGQKLWSKELRRRMRHVLWSPTGLELLLCSEAGEVFFYDSEGFYTHALCSLRSGKEQKASNAALVPVADVDWYRGDQQRSIEPALAIAYKDGCVEVLPGDVEGVPFRFDAHLVECTALAWRPTGEILAMLGRSLTLHPLTAIDEKADGKKYSLLRFYSSIGVLLHTLALPRYQEAQTFTWNTNGDKIVVASNGVLLFAKIRAKHNSAYFAGTLVYAVPTMEPRKYHLWFWNANSDSKHLRIVDKVLDIQAAPESCLVATTAKSSKLQQLEPTRAPYLLTVYTSIGDVILTVRSDSSPEYAAFTKTHIITAHMRTLCLWTYSTLPLDSRRRKENGNYFLSFDRKGFPAEGSEETYKAMQKCLTTSASCELLPDYSLPKGAGAEVSFKRLSLPGTKEADDIVSLTANSCCFIVATKCGELKRYSLPAVELQYKWILSSPPLTLQINNEGSRLAVIDVLCVLRVYDAFASGHSETNTPENRKPDLIYEREDVSHILWASDHPDSFVFTEKDAFYVVHGTVLEEAIQCSAHLLDFRNLCLRGFFFDQSMRFPSCLTSDFLYFLQTKPLRDTHAMLQNSISFCDALAYIDQKPHPILWQLLAIAAFETLNFTVVQDAYVRCPDYFGLLFLKYVATLHNAESQSAEVYAYFGKMDKAEQLYTSAGQMDLVVALRSRAGEWSRVFELLNEHRYKTEASQHALRELAESYKENGCWLEAIEICRRVQKKTHLSHALYVTEQYEELCNLAKCVNEGEHFLVDIGRKLASAGMCEEAVYAFQNAGNLRLAMEACLKFRKYGVGWRLVDHRWPEKEDRLLAQFTEGVLQQNWTRGAVHIHRKKGGVLKATTVILQRARATRMCAGSFDPLKLKMMYVFAALQVKLCAQSEPKLRGSVSEYTTEGYSVNAGNYLLRPRLPYKGRGGRALNDYFFPDFTDKTRLENDDGEGGEASACWRGAEAYHLYLLYHGLISKKRFSDAMCAAARLTEYLEYVESHVVHGMLALASYYAQNWWVCSTAFMRLGAVQTIAIEAKEAIATVALKIFSCHSPIPFAKGSPLALSCPHCHAGLESWNIMCQKCGASFPCCTGSGRPILAKLVDGWDGVPSEADEVNELHVDLFERGCEVTTCCTCRRKMLATVTKEYANCPLCHASLNTSPASETRRCSFARQHDYIKQRKQRCTAMYYY